MLNEAASVNLVVPRVVLTLPRAVLPDIKLSGDDSPVNRELVADLILFYAFDEPTRFKIVAERDLVRLGLDKQRLHDIALGNLRRMIPQPELHEVFPGVFMLVCGGYYEATTLLMDEVWQQILQMVDGNLVVAVPARDMVLITGDNNRDGLGFMRSKTSQILEGGDHTLSRHFLLRRGSEWIIYDGFAA